MIHLTAQTKILVATKPADFRQGIDGLAAVCRGRLSSDPRSGTLFVFINRSKTMVRSSSCRRISGSSFWVSGVQEARARSFLYPRSGGRMPTGHTIGILSTHSFIPPRHEPWQLPCHLSTNPLNISRLVVNRLITRGHTLC